MAKQSKNGELKIEHGIAIPNREGHKGYRKAVSLLQIGDSIVLPIHISGAYSYAGKILGKGNYAARTVEGGVRIWRTK